jgi:glycosyltransferase involved in cell wall biosynthesis
MESQLHYNPITPAPVQDPVSTAAETLRMLISVAICTYNRAELLDQTLDRLRRAEVPNGVDWELLVVDNNCSDHTQEVIGRYRAELPLRALRETRQGLSHARNCAIEAARGELLLWTDDDALVGRQWLSAYAQAAAEYPEAGFFGGPVEPWFAVAPPRWLQSNFAVFAGAYAVRSAPPGTLRLVDETLLPFGANFGLRMDAIGDARFDTQLGRIGTRLIGGEEVQFLSGMLARGVTGVWIEAAPVKHYIPAERISERYLWDYYYAKGQSRIRMLPAAGRPAPAGLRRKLRKQRLKRWTSGSRNTKRWARGFKATAMIRGMLDELASPQQ